MTRQSKHCNMASGRQEFRNGDKSTRDSSCFTAITSIYSSGYRRIRNRISLELTFNKLQKSTLVPKLSGHFSISKIRSPNKANKMCVFP